MMRRSPTAASKPCCFIARYRQDVGFQLRAGAAAVGVCVLLALSGCDGRSRSVFSCNENPTADVVESDTEVRVHVTSGRWLGRNGGDCADGVVVTLKAPLGARTIVDRSTGQTVELSPADQDVPPK